jgi:hypothetical protein
MTKWGIILQLLAGITLGLSHLLGSTLHSKINVQLSRGLSWPSSKPGRAIGVSLLAALSLASLGIALLTIMLVIPDTSSWEDILAIPIGGFFLAGGGGIAYIQSVKSISEKIKEKRISRHKGKRGIIEGDILKANLFLLITAILSGIISLLASFFIAKFIPFLLIFPALIFIFVVPAFIGSVSYFLIRGLIALLGTISQGKTETLDRLALGLFVAGGIILLIEVW